MLSMPDISILFGTLAFLFHLFGYATYGWYIFHGNIRPNAISWLMWLFGGAIEYVTYDAIEGSHWSSTLLPLACVISISGIFLTTLYIQLAQRRQDSRKKVVYHKPEKIDCYLTSFDLGAGVFWILGGSAIVANWFAVSTSIFTFLPIWRTTIQHGEEHPRPWILWTIAYAFMLGSVITQNDQQVVARSFFPVYYLILHSVMIFLLNPHIRSYLRHKISYP